MGRIVHDMLLSEKRGWLFFPHPGLRNVEGGLHTLAHPGVCALVTLSRERTCSAEKHMRHTCTPNIARCDHFGRTRALYPAQNGTCVAFFCTQPRCKRANWWVRGVAQAYIQRVCTRVCAHPGVCAVRRTPASAHPGVCAPGRLCTPASAHPGVCAPGRLCTPASAHPPGVCALRRLRTPASAHP